MFQTFSRLTIYLPISETDDLSDSSVATAGSVQAILQIFRGHDFAGSVGTYNAVAEISKGTETFVPTKASSPAQGETNVPSNVVSARLVTYVPITTARGDLDALIAEIVSAHPWEHPVLELDEVSLWMPS
jgi:hypothetical protein